MPTHKTKVEYIDAVQYFPEDEAELETFCGTNFCKDASFLFPGESWTEGYKVVHIGGTWLTLKGGQWIIKVNDVLDRIINDDEFQEKYEVV